MDGELTWHSHSPDGRIRQGRAVEQASIRRASYRRHHADPRKLVKISAGLAADTTGTTDHAGQILQSVTVGDWTSDAGSNAKFVWGSISCT